MAIAVASFGTIKSNLMGEKMSLKNSPRQNIIGKTTSCGETQVYCRRHMKPCTAAKYMQQSSSAAHTTKSH
jgi:hypothetical protein